MEANEVKPLHPLPFGNVLIVGVKASNLDEEIRTHPRVIMWDSQQQHWSDKELPANVRAVFVTRFIGHTMFANIIKEARKRQITIFNPQGTGIITRQVKELLDLHPVVHEYTVELPETIQEVKETEMKKTTSNNKNKGKLKALIPFIDFNKSTIVESAKLLMEKAHEMGITTTQHSLEQFVRVQLKTQTQRVLPKVSVTETPVDRRSSLDVTVEILDNAIMELKDIRGYLIAVTKENQTLKAKLNKFKKFFED